MLACSPARAETLRYHSRATFRDNEGGALPITWPMKTRRRSTHNGLGRDIIVLPEKRTISFFPTTGFFETFQSGRRIRVLFFPTPRTQLHSGSKWFRSEYLHMPYLAVLFLRISFYNPVFKFVVEVELVHQAIFMRRQLCTNERFSGFRKFRVFCFF